MANTLRFKRGLVSGIPTAALGEPLFTTDTFDLYIGNGTGNTRFQKYIASGTTGQLLRGDGSLLTMPIVLTSPSNGQVLKYDGTNWVNSSDTGITTLNTLTALTQTFATGTSGTDFAISSAGSTHTFNIPTASATNRGLLSSADWTTFNNKQNALTNPITGTGASGQVAYWSGTNTQTGSNNLFWDNSTGRLGINRPSPSYILDIGSSGLTIASVRGGSSTNQSAAFYVTKSDSSGTLTAYGDEAAITGGTPNLAAMLFTAASIPLKFYLNGALRMTLNESGRLLLGSSTDNGLRFQVTGDGYFSGSVGVGSSALTSIGLRVAKTITGGTLAYAVLQDGQVQSDVTNQAHGFYNTLSTQATSFTLSNYYHYRAFQGALGAGSAVTNQYGFFVQSNLTGATNNYGFYGDIASGTNRWNLYMNGSANNYLAGSLGIGATSGLGDMNVRITKALAGSVFPTSVYNGGTIAQAATTGAVYFLTDATTENATFTLPNLYHYWARQVTFGASSTVTNQYGFFVDSSLIGATNDYGFYGNIASGTGRWNLYMNGTANNYMAGSLGIGITTPTVRLQVENNENSSNGIFTRNTNSGNAATSFIATVSNAGQINLTAHSTTHAVWANTAIINTTTGLTGGLVTFVGAGNYDVWTNNTFRMRLDASGNLGLGVTPSAWNNTFRAMQVGSAGSFYARTGGIEQTGMASNAFFSSSTNDWRYIQNGFASYHIQSDSIYRWFTAPSGTAGNAITFTQAMTLHSTGNLAIGTGAGADAGFRLDVNGTMRVSGASAITTNVDAASGLDVINQNTGTSARGRIKLGSANSNWYFDAVRIGGRLSISNDISGTATELFQIANTGAATFSSSLTVDTDTFFVDATNNRVGVGTITPSYKAHIVNNASSPTYLALQNTTAGSTSAAIMKVISDASSGSGEFLKKSSTGNTYKVMTSNDLVIYNDTAGDIDIFNDHANGKINLTSGGSSSTHLTLDTSGRLGFSNNSPTAYCDLSASTTAIASLRIRSGSAPTAPNDGDIWFDGTDLKIRVAGVTKTFTLV